MSRKLQAAAGIAGPVWFATLVVLRGPHGPSETAFPGTPEQPQWQVIKRTYFYDPVPRLRRLKVPTLAMWGELDNNIMADKNKPAWDTALKTAAIATTPWS